MTTPTPTVAEQIAAFDRRIDQIRADTTALREMTAGLRAARLKLDAWCDEQAARRTAAPTLAIGGGR